MGIMDGAWRGACWAAAGITRVMKSLRGQVQPFSPLVHLSVPKKQREITMAACSVTRAPACLAPAPRVGRTRFSRRALRVYSVASSDYCILPEDYSEPPSPEKRRFMNYMLATAVALPSAGLLVPYLDSFVPKR